MIELIQVASGGTLALTVLIFGFLPGFVLRLLVKIYPREDPRRRELVAELYTIHWLARPYFVAQQFETVLFEGLPQRLEGTFMRVICRITPWTVTVLGEMGDLYDHDYVKAFDDRGARVNHASPRSVVLVQKRRIRPRLTKLAARAHLYRELGPTWSIAAVATIPVHNLDGSETRHAVMYSFELRTPSQPPEAT